MRVRRLDRHHDWTFGQGSANYATQSDSIAQRVKTRLWSFRYDWFLDLDHGLPWLEKVGRNVDLNDLEIKIKRCVLSTQGVSYITDYQANFDPDTRKLTVSIDYVDIFNHEQQINYEA